uniref:G protein-coupled receptor n=1 Tax=Caenorhabditis tropicalis TaxID=1561998 RepID=A0A1I7V447_9PELO
MMISDGVVGGLTSLCTIYRLRKYKISYDKVQYHRALVPSWFQSLLLVTTLHIFPDALVTMFNLDMIFQISGDSRFMNELSRMFLVFLVSFNSLTIVCTNRQIRQEYLKMLCPTKKIFRFRNSVSKAFTAPSERITVF